MTTVPTKTRQRHPVRALVLLAQPTLMIIVTIIVLIQWRLPTSVRIILRIPLTADSYQQNLTPAQLQSLPVRSGRLEYPDYPQFGAVMFAAPEQFEFQPRGQFQIQKIIPDPEHAEQQVHLVGMAESLILHTPHGVRDCRLTRFDILSQSPFAIILGIAVWLLFTAIGWYRLYQEVKD